MNVALNFAISADGKIGTRAGGASKFTSRADLERLWEIRKSADAIMVGRGTLEADHMTMTIPVEAQPRIQPLRFIISRKGCFNAQHPVFQKEGGALHLLATESPVCCEVLPAVAAHHMPLRAFLDYAERELQVETLLCEGGGQLVRALAELGVISTIHLTFAGHTLIGGAQAPGILGTLQEHLPCTQNFSLTHFQPLESGECFLTYRVKKG